MQPATLALTVSNVSKQYGSRPVLRNISLQVGIREILGVQGANGVGKTTLLRLLAQLERPDRGSIRFHGGTGSCALGYSWQSATDALFPWLDGRRNVSFSQAVDGAPSKDRQRLLEEVRATLGWDVPLHLRPYQMSGGNRQKLNVMRAMVGMVARSEPNGPRMLILDEPTAGLDTDSRAAFFSGVQEFAAVHGATVVFSTHDSEELVFLSDRVLTLTAGDSLWYEIPCPHQRPRPLSWLQEPSFDEALIRFRHRAHSHAS